MIGFIVDGVGDHAAFKARYGNSAKVLKAEGPRGHTVSAEALAVSCRKQVHMLELMGCSSIVIVTDFEGRGGAASDFCIRVERALVGSNRVRVACADRMIENWILADIAYIATLKVYLKSPVKQKSFESLHGKQEIKKLFNKGYDYSEVKHGPEMFSLVRGREASARSASFKDFAAKSGLES